MSDSAVVGAFPGRDITRGTCLLGRTVIVTVIIRKDVGLPVDVLVDTVARMQQDLASLRAENRLLRTPAVPQVVRAPR